MGKWYSHKIYIQHKEDVKLRNTEDANEIEFYYPYVIKIANTFPRNSIAIGTLDINDLIQAGYEGLVKAWEIVETDRHQGEVWNFIKKRIKWSIRREIDKSAMIISVPINKLEKTRNELHEHSNYLDKVLVNVFPKFFDGEVIDMYYTGDSWRSIQLEDIIITALNKHVVDINHRDILLKFYGIGYDKKSTKQLAEEYGKKTGAIAKIIQRTKDKLVNEEFEKIIENFYENES